MADKTKTVSLFLVSVCPGAVSIYKMQVSMPVDWRKQNNMLQSTVRLFPSTALLFHPLTLGTRDAQRRKTLTKTSRWCTVWIFLPLPRFFSPLSVRCTWIIFGLFNKKWVFRRMTETEKRFPDPINILEVKENIFSCGYPSKYGDRHTRLPAGYTRVTLVFNKIQNYLFSVRVREIEVTIITLVNNNKRRGCIL